MKAVLCITHGNAEVERSLSENKKMLSKERTLLTDSSVNGLRMEKYSVKVSCGSVADINMTKGLLEAGGRLIMYIKEEWRKKNLSRKQSPGNKEKTMLQLNKQHELKICRKTVQ